MNIVAIDDEILSLNALVSAIKEARSDAQLHSFLKSEQFIEYIKEYGCDVAFLDIQMRNTSGIELAKYVKSICPETNIVFVTGYSDYMVDAFEIHASGYVLKPATKEKIEKELDNLRHQVNTGKPHVWIQTFGNFELFLDGKPISYTRSKAKELLAYLIDRNGAGASTAEISAMLWEDKECNRSLQKQTQTIISQLMKTLRENGIEDIIIKSWNSLAVDKSKLSCDLYDFLDGKISGINAYTGEYMNNYSWAELTAGGLTLKI